MTNDPILKAIYPETKEVISPRSDNVWQRNESPILNCARRGIPAKWVLSRNYSAANYANDVTNCTAVEISSNIEKNREKEPDYSFRQKTLLSILSSKISRDHRHRLSILNRNQNSAGEWSEQKHKTLRRWGKKSSKVIK